MTYNGETLGSRQHSGCGAGKHYRWHLYGESSWRLYIFGNGYGNTLRESAKAAAEKIAAVWDVKAKSSTIYDYDAAVINSSF